MITGISKLKSFGIFQDFKPSKELKPFVQYNLLYGWNGSGKSTLAKMFLSIADKKMHDHFPTSEFTLQAKDCPDITHKNVSTNPLNIKVFNKDFIERNVNFEQSNAKSILILSEEKKEEMEKYKSLQTEHDKKKAAYKASNDEFNSLTETLKKDISKWASSIKKSFELIETSNSYYLNYDRTKLTNFIKEESANINSTAILTADDVKNLKNAIKPNRKNDLVLDSKSLIDTNSVQNNISEIESLLSKSIFSEQIERLSNNPDINTWVKQGLDLKTKHKNESCDFCGQPISDLRIESLNKHFSKDYDELMAQISASKLYLDQLKDEVITKAPDAFELYDEFQSEYQASLKLLNEGISQCNTLIGTIKEEVEEKNKNPFKIFSTKFAYIETSFKSHAENFIAIRTIIEKHNKKNESFDEEVKKAQRRLELNFVSEKLIEEKYRDTEKKITDKRESLKSEEVALTNLTAEVKKLEDILLNEAVGADGFNKNLEKFIGRKDISLEFDSLLKGYKLRRYGKTDAAKNLSEGEKTAIAFVYFVTKLKENGNSIENTIIVVDDPISSFDSNHLFHAYSFLKQECEQATQLFILTHNFQYFKLVRDWILKKNERKKKQDGSFEEKIRSNFYSIDCTLEEDRKSIISNADSTLINFNSEYHYIYNKLNYHKTETTLNLEKAFLIANLSRKLLEAFLTFKFPKGRNDFMALLQSGCTDPDIREKVYRFINKYSHNKEIDFQDSPIDNLMGEGNNIITDVFKIVENLDKAHFDEMQEVCAN